MASWNPVLNFFCETKNAFAEKFGEEHLFDYLENHTYSTCIEYWAYSLQDARAIGILENLILREWKGLLLFHYGYLQDTVKEESTGDQVGFWQAYGGIYMECRSVVIDIYNDTLVLTPFRKFLNIGEVKETSVDTIARQIKRAKTIEFSNKLDGSMQSARWYQNHIVMSGSKTLDPACSFQLEEGFRWIKNDARYIRLLRDFEDYTCIFEHISMNDKHIVVYSKSDEGLHLIGMRRVADGKERSYAEVISIANEYSIPTTWLQDSTLDEVLDSLDSKKSDEAEGFVLNIDGYKVKIKYNDFVDMHAILAAMSSPNVIIRQIADGTWDDFFSKIPESYHDQVMEIAKKVFRFAKTKEALVSKYYSELRSQNFDNKRDSMIWINENVPQNLQGFVRNRYLGNPTDVLKRANAYVKIADIENFLVDIG